MDEHEYRFVIIKDMLEKLNYYFCPHCNTKLMNIGSKYCSERCEMFDALKGVDTTKWSWTEAELRWK